LRIQPHAGPEPPPVNRVVIPFFEATLKQRLPSSTGTALISLDRAKGWIGMRDSLEIKAPGSLVAASQGNTVWLPDNATATAWQQFSRGGGH